MTGLRRGSGYFPTAFDSKELCNRAKTMLKGVQFDTVVGSGVSGVLPLLTIATALKVNTMVVRKPVDLNNSHCGSLIEGQLDHKWLFVDDFCATGKTFARVWEAVDRACQSEWVPHQCVGAFLYESDKVGAFFDLKSATLLWSSVNKAVSGRVFA